MQSSRQDESGNIKSNWVLSLISGFRNADHSWKWRAPHPIRITRHYFTAL